MTLPNSGTNFAKVWKISQERCFALRITLENDGQTIKSKLLSNAVGHLNQPSLKNTVPASARAAQAC